MDIAHVEVSSRLAAEVLVSGSVHTHVARMTHLGSGFLHSGRPATSGRENASRCGKEAKRRTQLGKKPRLSSAPAGRLRRGVESLGSASTHRRSASPESDMTSEAAHFCRATRGHTSGLFVMPSAWVDRPQRAASMEQLCQASQQVQDGFGKASCRCRCWGWSSRLRLSQVQVRTLSSGSTWPEWGLR